MNAWSFYKLLREIFKADKPDLDLIQDLGLLAVKIGQVFALRPDFLSDDKCRELAKLYRRTNPVPAENLDKLIANAGGSDYLKNFIDFNRTPIASASVGQVHRASLKNGEVVAVKIIKRDVAQAFIKEVTQVKKLLAMSLWLYPKLSGVANPAELIGEIEKTTLAELDLKNEAAGYNELAEIAGRWRDRFDLKNLGDTKVYPQFSHERVLVTKFFTGPTLDELLENNALPYEKLLEFFRLQGFFMYAEGIFHGDIHPGNIILQDDKFYFVDAGYIGRVGDKIRINLLKFFDALSQYDYQGSAACLHQMSEVELSTQQYQKYEQQFLALYKDFKNATVAEVSLTKKMMQTIRMAVLNGMSFPTGMFDIIKSHMYLDGMVLRCNPKAVLLPDMRRYVEEFKKFIIPT